MSKYRSELIDIYSLYVSIAISSEEKRQQISQVYLTLVAAAIASAGYLTSLDALYVLIPSGFLSAIWLANVVQYRRLAKVKFEIILDMEKELCFDPFTKEWQLIKERLDPNLFDLRQTVVEAILPSASLVFSCLFALIRLF